MPDKPLFDCIHCDGKSRSNTLAGMYPVLLATPSYFYKKTPAGYNKTRADKATVINKFNDVQNKEMLWHLDLEDWPPGEEDKVVEVAEWIHERWPHAYLGLYAPQLAPPRKYWAIWRYYQELAKSTDKRSSKFIKYLKDIKEWRKYNATQRRGANALIRHFSCTMPSLYTVQNKPEQWRVFAQKTIEACQLFDRPCYPVIWPIYHGWEEHDGSMWIPLDFWRLQMETCLKYADGVQIIQFKRSGTWSSLPQQAWWSVTRHYI